MASLMRLSRLMARSGACSRRQADAAISEGRVRVGNRLASLGEYVDAAKRPSVYMDDRPLDTKEVDNKPKIYLAYKKRNELVTRPDTDDRPSIFARLRLGRHLASVGRLDYDSEGLLVLTTCGNLARSLEHPDIGNFVRIYEVSTRGTVTPSKLTAMRRGVRVNGIKYQPLEVRVLRSEASRVVFQIRCTQGKNRMIRNICDHLRLRVTKLVRTHFGPFKLEQITKNKPIQVTSIPGSVQKLIDENEASSLATGAKIAKRNKKLKKVDTAPKMTTRADEARRDPPTKAAENEKTTNEPRRMRRQKTLAEKDDGTIPESTHRRAGRLREARKPKRNKKTASAAKTTTHSTDFDGHSPADDDDDRPLPPIVENRALSLRRAPSSTTSKKIGKPRDPNSERRKRRRKLAKV